MVRRTSRAAAIRVSTNDALLDRRSSAQTEAGDAGQFGAPTLVLIRMDLRAHGRWRDVGSLCVERRCAHCGLGDPESDEPSDERAHVYVTLLSVGCLTTTRCESSGNARVKMSVGAGIYAFRSRMRTVRRPTVE